MKAIPPELRAKHRRLLNFMLSREFSKLSDATGKTYVDPVSPKKQPDSNAQGKRSRRHAIWCIDTPEGFFVLDATFTKGASGKMRYRSYWSFLPGPSPAHAL